MLSFGLAATPAVAGPAEVYFERSLIAQANARCGLFDAATVELWRVDWTQVDLRVRLWAGTLARIRRENGAFVADLDGPMALLERVVDEWIAGQQG